MKSLMRSGYLRLALTLLLAAPSLQAYAQPSEPILSLAKKEKTALLESLKALVSIETDTRDSEGLGELAALITSRMETLCGVSPLGAQSDAYTMEDTPQT